MIDLQNSSGGDAYSRFIGKLNYIGQKLLTIGKKNQHSNLGLTLTKGDTYQLCQVLRVSEEELMRRYKGQTVIYYDLEGRPQAWINLILYDEGGE